jgi:hypothetical protein
MEIGGPMPETDANDLAPTASKSKAIQQFVEDMTAQKRVLVPDYKSCNGKYYGPAIVARTWEDLVEIAKTSSVLLEADPITRKGVFGNLGFFAYPRLTD